jgi:hypothetical protein
MPLSQTEQHPQEKNGTLSYATCGRDRPSTCGSTPVDFTPRT